MPPRHREDPGRDGIGEDKLQGGLRAGGGAAGRRQALPAGRRGFQDRLHGDGLALQRGPRGRRLRAVRGGGRQQGALLHGRPRPAPRQAAGRGQGRHARRQLRRRQAIERGRGRGRRGAGGRQHAPRRGDGQGEPPHLLGGRLPIGQGARLQRHDGRVLRNLHRHIRVAGQGPRHGQGRAGKARGRAGEARGRDGEGGRGRQGPRGVAGHRAHAPPARGRVRP